jgi:predicted double-glycine peptidase
MKLRRISFLILMVAALSPLTTHVARSGEIELSGQGINIHVASMQERRDSRIVRQQYDFSCGSAALATLLTFSYDTPQNEATVFKAMYAVGDQEHIKKFGFSLLDMQKYLASINLHADGFKVTLDQLQQLRVPAIALISPGGYNHFVVVRGSDAHGLLIADPRLGLRRLAIEDFSEVWNGIIFVIRDNSDKAGSHFNDPADLGLLPMSPKETALIFERQDLSSFLITLPGFHDY